VIKKVIMKTFLLLIIPFILFASGKMMSNSDYLYLNGKYLIYKITTKNYRVTLNALDGTAIEKESK
jgi:hypothetical protein